MGIAAGSVRVYLIRAELDLPSPSVATHPVLSGPPVKWMLGRLFVPLPSCGQLGAKRNLDLPAAVVAEYRADKLELFRRACKIHRSWLTCRSRSLKIIHQSPTADILNSISSSAKTI